MKKYLGFIAATFLLVEGFSAGAAIANEWGAVGIGPNGAYGWAVDFEKEQDAINYAVSACQGECRGFSFSNSCAAIAKGGGYIGWAQAPSKSTAQAIALEQCGNSSSCEIQVWGCTGSGTTD